MSCLDVMYQQSYGAHYLPEAYRASYVSQQQRKLSSKMQNCLVQQQQQVRGSATRDQRSGPEAPADQKDASQPAGAEYLSSRCVLFTYFHGEIGDEVDEHFSRALSQTSFRETPRPPRLTPESSSAGSWKDVSPEGHGSVWSSYSSPPGPSAHPDFCPSPVSHADGPIWAGHVLSQAGLPPLASIPDSWTYNLNSQSGYPGVHEVYHPHPIHTRHHPMFHSYPPHSSALEARFSPLLLPGVRSQNSTGSSPHSEGVKTEMDPSRGSPTTSVSWTPSPLHGSLDVYDSGTCDPNTHRTHSSRFTFNN